MFRPIVVAFLTLGLVSGCSGGKRIPAVGPGWEIVILTPPSAGSLGAAVAGILSREVRVVHFEPTFVTEEADLKEFSFYRTRKLLFVVGDSDDEEVQKVLRRATGTRTRTSFPGLWIEKDPFSAGQLMFILTGPPASLAEALTARQDELLHIVDEAAVELIVTNLYRTGEMEGARQRMLQRWGWGVRVPAEWMIDDRFAGENFVRVWRDAPVAQLFVSWEAGHVERSPEEWLKRRDELVRRFYDGDEVVFSWSETKAGKSPFGPDGVKLEGLWENDRYVIGGPFRSWAFYCPQDDRTYLVDDSVYAPDRSKQGLLRTLEAVGRTFRCGCVRGPADEPAP